MRTCTLIRAGIRGEVIVVKCVEKKIKRVLIRRQLAWNTGLIFGVSVQSGPGRAFEVLEECHNDHFSLGGKY